MKKNTPKKWTLIFLLSAKNNLYMEQLKVINEIYGVGSSKDVNLVIILDGLGGDKFSESLERPAIFFPQKNTDFLTDTHFDILRSHKATLTNKADLKNILNKVVENFPASHYGFFYKGHGGPAETDLARGIFVTRTAYIDPKWSDSKLEKEYGNKQKGWFFEGYCEYPAVKRNSINKKPILLIYSKRNNKTLTYYGLSTVLRSVFKGRLDFLCMDCCWAQQIENAYSFANVTRYYVASADEMPALGLGYTILCNHFIKRPALRADEAANLIVSTYYNVNYSDYDSEQAEFRKMGVSVTSLDLNAYDTFLTDFTELCEMLTKQLNKKDDYTYYLINNARSKCLDYTYQNTDKLSASKIEYPMFNIDLIWLLENLLYYNLDDKREELILRIVYKLQGRLTTSFMSSNYKKPAMGNAAIGGNGIAICFPKNKGFADLSILKRTEMRFYQKSGWKKLLTTYYDYKPKISMKECLKNAGMNGFGFEVDNKKRVPRNKKRLVLKQFKKTKKNKRPKR
ncbi:MAG TPA: clostripain-related cysteine peptidase [Chitinophagaceae bacterium]|jgi:hypothetical protein|nr:clostripain-related cysteine peptidase [Chitinophagaceae bacterium]